MEEKTHSSLIIKAHHNEGKKSKAKIMISSAI
jgi:hypothetical protein